MTDKEGEQFATGIKAQFFMTSAKNNTGVKELFNALDEIDFEEIKEKKIKLIDLRKKQRKRTGNYFNITLCDLFLFFCCCFCCCPKYCDKKSQERRERKKREQQLLE